MPKNKISDLRNHLFATLEALQDPDKPMEIERARAISEVAQTVINSAKVELQFIELTGQEAKSEFLNTVKEPARLPSPIKLRSSG